MILKRDYIFFFLILLLAGRCVAAQGNQYATSSVLKKGSWAKIAVVKTGVYKLTWSEIRNMGFTNPADVALYGNNMGELSFYNDGTAPDDLRKISIKIEKGSDGIFNDGDYIVFYAEGTHRWNYNYSSKKSEFSRHYYSDTAFYFLTAIQNDARIIKEYNQPSATPSYTSDSYDFNFRYENESVNLINSGREWYQSVSSGTRNTIDPQLKDVITGENINYRIRVLARSDRQASFSFGQGTDVTTSLYPPVIDLSDINGLYASIATKEGSIAPSSASPVFFLTFYNNGNSSASGYIDYVELHGRSQLKYNTGQLIYSDTKSIGAGQVTKFKVESASDLQVWDVTDPFNPESVRTSFSSGTVTYQATTDSLCKYVAFTSSALLSPVVKGRPVANQDLHAPVNANMIIVTHPLFLNQAARLAAIHEKSDNIKSVIVTPEQIYNEFSGGIPDAAAIRNYVKMVWERESQSSTPLKYLLLFGDGSYDNKTLPSSNTNYIPTWQSVNSNVGVLSFTSDDFYGLLEDDEGESDGTLDVGIGRLPVADTTSAGLMVRKVRSYISHSAFGSWRNIVCMVADDEDNNLHMTDAENLSATIAEQAPAITNEKIYFDSYRQETSISGNTYPDATAAINTRINSGCLIFNYVGHASESGLAHERVVRIDDINSWTNFNTLPLFITATCEFSRFDNVTINSGTGAIAANTSAGEMVLLNPHGGGIALMSTTRVVYSAPNYTLNSNIIKNAFENDETGVPRRLGDIIKVAKNNSGSGTNKRNFLLLGDPAVRLALPDYGTVVTDSINGVSTETATDTLKALAVITIKGHIEGPNGKTAVKFNGTVEPVVYDKPVQVTTLANDGGEKMQYYAPGNVIYKGQADIVNGLFSFTFMVPHDIDYSYGTGAIKYYAWNDSTDVNGCFSKVVIGGFSNNTVDDTEGPVIKLYMNDTLFSDGGVTDDAPTLLAIFSDKSGINASGTGIGHDITAWFDGNTSESVVLNSLFKSEKAGFTSGSLSYPFTMENSGDHYVTVRAWDNLNNFSESTLSFTVNTGKKFRISDLSSYPNPTVTETSFSFSHNRPDENIDIKIDIFSSAGNLVRTIKESILTSGYRIKGITWDGCNETGDRVGKGIYIWRVEAITKNKERSYASARVIIL
ncbi:MAG TPA: type IX secretion system sortase PorU [Bacteroidales bacterium]|nr:type IX secretion system sortase PorU [Bacteroidales bacterium]